jgi:hypothetical protein
MTSRASGFRHKYGVAGAGAVGKSLIGRLPGKARDIGVVAGVSFRVASRIANALRAGRAARSANELDGARCVLFHAPPDQAPGLLHVLQTSAIEWAGKVVVICDSEVNHGAVAWFRERGASVAAVKEFGIAGYLAIEGIATDSQEGKAPALATAHRIARDLHLKAIEIPHGAAIRFDAALTLATCAFTPLIDRVATMLRHAGVREVEAPSLAAALFQKTAADYIHSGKQSWGWYMRGPEVTDLNAQIDSVGPELESLFRQLVLLGFDAIEKYADIAAAIRTDAITVSDSQP